MTFMRIFAPFLALVRADFSSQNGLQWKPSLCADLCNNLHKMFWCNAPLLIPLFLRVTELKPDGKTEAKTAPLYRVSF